MYKKLLTPSPQKKKSKWLHRLDYKVDDEENKVVIKDVEDGQLCSCDKECMTIAKVCRDIIQDYESELVGMLYNTKNKRARIQSALCYEATDYCTGRPPKLPRKRTVLFFFLPYHFSLLQPLLVHF